MKKPKPKPATAGEKVVLSWLGGLTTLSELRDQHNPTLSETRGLAHRIDAAIRRAVKAERERCATWAAYAEYGGVSRYTAWKGIEDGREPEQ